MLVEATGNFQVAFVVIKAASQLCFPVLVIAGGLAMPLTGEIGHTAGGGVVAGAEVEVVDLKMPRLGLEAAVGAVAAAALFIFHYTAELETSD